MAKRRKEAEKSFYNRVGSELNELLDFPHGLCLGKSKGVVAARAVIKVIKDALLRGDFVSVEGFGRLSVKTAKETERNTFIGQGCLVEKVKFPPRKYVYFKPSPNLRRFVNEPFRENSDGTENS